MDQYKDSRKTLERAKKDKLWHSVRAYGDFKQQAEEIAHEKPWIWQWKANIKRKTESLLIEAQNNAIRTNYIKVKIDSTQKNSKLCRQKDEMFNHIMSRSDKLA